MERYVDDVDLVAEEILLGALYEDGKLVVKQGEIEGMFIQANKRTMVAARNIRNSIHHSIQLEVDYPSN